MLTIKKISSSDQAVGYYADYAQEKGEVQGRWFDPSQSLDLQERPVQLEALTNLLKGYSPEGKIALCQAPGSGHHPGWDLTFSAPKSVSIAWANADVQLRSEIEAAQNAAVEAALAFLSREATFVRTKEGGHSLEKARLVAALFQHSSNRAEEPQLHTHALVMNVAKTDSDGKWRTLHSRPIYRAYMAAGALYKAEMAERLQALGFTAEKTKNSFELKGVPQHVCEAQSSRSQAIEEALKSKGLTRETASAVAKEMLALKTRAEKDDQRITRDFGRWQEENTRAGFGPREQMETVDRTKSAERQPLSVAAKTDMAAACLDQLTAQASTFSHYELYRQVAEASISRTGAAGVDATVAIARNSGELLALGTGAKQEERFSTREMVKLEQMAMAVVDHRRGEDRHRVDGRLIAEVLEHHPTMTGEQAAALRHIVSGKDGVSFIEGDAGTGKSFLMRAVREVYESSGFEVRGVSFTNKAAQGLGEGSGIKSCQSVDSFLIEQRRHHRGVGKKTILVLDEAAMLDSRKTKELLTLCAEAGTKVIAIGDQKQIQPIAAGQAFGSMKRTFGAGRLAEIRRQKEEWVKAAIRDLAEGRTKSGVDALQQNQSLRFADDREAARKAIIAEWQKSLEGAGKMDLRTAPLMIVATNNEVDQLNARAREHLVTSKGLSAGTPIQTTHGQQNFAAGDRIVFTGNFKKKGIFNSGVATIERMVQPSAARPPQSIVVRTESGRRVKFSPESFPHFRHGYAITAHKAQGITVDRALVLVDGAFMDREKFYVAVSRGREKPIVFADKVTLGVLSWEERQEIAKLDSTKRESAEGEAYKIKLARLVGASHEKDTSQDYPYGKQRIISDFQQRMQDILGRIEATTVKLAEQIRDIARPLGLGRQGFQGEKKQELPRGREQHIEAEIERE